MGNCCVVTPQAPVEIMKYQVTQEQYAQMRQRECMRAIGPCDRPVRQSSRDRSEFPRRRKIQRPGSAARPAIFGVCRQIGNGRRWPDRNMPMTPLAEILTPPIRRRDGSASMRRKAPRRPSRTRPRIRRDISASMRTALPTCPAMSGNGPAPATPAQRFPADGSVISAIGNCGVRIVEGRHRAYMTDFVRDAKTGGCAVGAPPDLLGMRLVREEPGLLSRQWLRGFFRG